MALKLKDRPANEAPVHRWSYTVGGPEIREMIDRRLNWYGTRHLRAGGITALDERTVRVEIVDSIAGDTALFVDIDRLNGHIMPSSVQPFIPAGAPYTRRWSGVR